MSPSLFGCSGVALIQAGHVALIACFLAYLAWWVVFFRPTKPVGALRTLGICAIVVAALAGIVGIALTCLGIIGLPEHTRGFFTWQVVVGGLVAYVALFTLTAIGLSRPPTSELMIISLWLTLEAATVNALFSTEVIDPLPTIVLLLVLAFLMVVSLVCYVRFYKLEGWASCIDGAVPLVCGIVYAFLVLLIL